MTSVGRKSGLITIAGHAAMVSGVLGVAMVATLFVMYGLFAMGPGARDAALEVGWVNDVLAIVVYGMALPVVPALHVLVREAGRTRSVVLALVGGGALVATIVLQWLLASGRMTFEAQILPVSIALLGVGVWMVGTGALARATGFLPNGVRDGLLGMFYVGYPVWAIDVGRRLVERRRT
ncbi:MAG: hypothetical protein HY264_10305 [Chloroflexi bacterium]|nr:hypothetical protein [Chloroflexota bacterium]